MSSHARTEINLDLLAPLFKRESQTLYTHTPLPFHFLTHAAAARLPPCLESPETNFLLSYNPLYIYHRKKL